MDWVSRGVTGNAIPLGARIAQLQIVSMSSFLIGHVWRFPVFREFF
ncbi:MAG: hypothetical protein LAO23_05355 [Acidobacteriia bacterium]|nr:hypothetical protein [Terriglobia bacterium]